MLIGPTITLAKLETRMREALNRSKDEVQKKSRSLTALQKEINSLPRTLETDKGRIANDEYVSKYLTFQTEEKELNAAVDRVAYLKGKIGELESFESNAKNKGIYVSKEEETITLTLKDVAMLQLPSEDLEPAKPETVEV